MPRRKLGHPVDGLVIAANIELHVREWWQTGGFVILFGGRGHAPE
jgi:hypothetical protein